MGLTASPGGEIGRRKGLKILFRASGVRVQVPPRAPVLPKDVDRFAAPGKEPNALRRFFFAATKKLFEPSNHRRI